MIPNEGMPKHKSPFEKGNLYIQFNVEFPKPGVLKDNQLQQLEKLLPPRRPVPKQNSEYEEVSLTKVATEKGARGPEGARRRATSDEEDEDEQQGQRVQCAQQ